MMEAKRMGGRESSRLLPIVRGVAYGCWQCSAILDADTMRELMTDAWSRRFYSEEEPYEAHDEWVSCPECDAPGTLVKVEVSMVPGVLDWNAGHAWMERGAV